MKKEVYSFGELLDTKKLVLSCPDREPAEDYSVFYDEKIKRFGFFKNGDFRMGYFPGVSYPIGEYFGYDAAYSYCLDPYGFDYYLALQYKDKWIIYAVDWTGYTEMARVVGSFVDAHKILTSKIGLYLRGWKNLADGSTVGEGWFPDYDIKEIRHFSLPSPEKITKLKDNQVFVFGSNLHGQHAGGAARYAYEHFGAILGQGAGLQGNSYAIPTMHISISEIESYISDFLAFAAEHPEKEFLVTKIGCGIAGFKDEEIAPFFEQARGLANVRLPEAFIKLLS